MNIVKPVCKFLKRNGPLILSITASVGVVATAVLTGKAVLTVDEMLENVPEDKMKSKETKLAVLKAYIPPILTGTGTIACIIGAHCMNRKIQVGLIAAYGMVDSAFKSYRSKIDSDTDTATMEEVRKERIQNIVIVEHPNERQDEKLKLWIDDYSDEPYWATENDILAGMYDINRHLSNWSTWSANPGRGYADLRDLYKHTIGPHNPIAETIGWSWDYMQHEWECTWIDYAWTDKYTIKDKDGNDIQCNYIEFFCPPIAGFLDYDPDKE